MLGTVGRQVVLYLTLPLFTRLVAPSEFGLIATGTAIYALVNTISSAGLPAAIFRLYHEETGETGRTAVLSAGMLLLLALALATVIGFVVFSALGIKSVEFPVSVAILIGALVIADTWIYFSQIVIRIHERTTFLSVTVIGQLVLQIAGALLALTLIERSAKMYWAGFLAGSALTGLVLLLNGGVVRYQRPARPVVRALFAYGLPFLPVTAFLWAMRYSDRMFVSAFMTNTDVAIYDVAARTGAIAGFFVPGIALAWPQFAFSRLADPNRDAIYKAALSIITAVTCAVAIYVAVFRRQLLHAFAPPEYQAGTAVVILISVSQIPFAIYYVASTGLKLSKETGLIAWSAGAAALVHVVISAVLTPRLGIIGPALATVCSTSVLALLMCVLGQKRARIVDVTALLRLTGVAVITAGVTWFADGASQQSAILNLGAIAMVSLAAATVLWTAIGREHVRNSTS